MVKKFSVLAIAFLLVLGLLLLSGCQNSTIADDTNNSSISATDNVDAGDVSENIDSVSSAIRVVGQVTAIDGENITLALADTSGFKGGTPSAMPDGEMEPQATPEGGQAPDFSGEPGESGEPPQGGGDRSQGGGPGQGEAAPDASGQPDGNGQAPEGNRPEGGGQGGFNFSLTGKNRP